MIEGERLVTPSGVTAVLEAYGLATRKSLGQNFLVDRHALAGIVDAAALQPEDVVLEIGPGLGVLTRELAAACRAVIAIELDAGFVRWLNDLFEAESSGDRVRLVHEDALTADFGALLADHPPGPGGVHKVVANLPYYITSPLLMRLLEEQLPFATIIVMVQREVARRLTAAPGTKDYGALSVAVQLRAEVETVLVVPPGAFYPPPKVDSAVVRLRLRPFPESVKEPGVLRAAVRTAFGQRRKTVRNAWRHAAVWAGADTDRCVRPTPIVDALDSALSAAGVDGSRRGETLTPREFIRVANELARSGITFPSPS